MLVKKYKHNLDSQVNGKIPTDLEYKCCKIGATYPLFLEKHFCINNKCYEIIYVNLITIFSLPLSCPSRLPFLAVPLLFLLEIYLLYYYLTSPPSFSFSYNCKN